MIHTNPADAARVEYLHGDALEGKIGSVRYVENNEQGYVMILIPYSKHVAEGLIESLKHGY